MSIPLFNADNPQYYPPRASPLIAGILHKPKMTTIWGPPGAGKSLIGLDLACVVAQDYPVIYIAAEAVDEFLPRLDAWKEHYAKSLKHLWFWREPVMVLDPASCQQFLDAVIAMKPAVIFIDPLAECFVGGDENSTRDMTTAIRNINVLRTALQASICILHHSGWDGGHERGSSVLRGATRLNLSVRSQHETIVLKAHKCNAGRLASDRYFKVQEIGSEERIILVPTVREMHPITGTLPKRQREVLTALAMSIFRDGVQPVELATYLSMTRSTFYQVTNALVDRELAGKQPKSGLLFLTDLGDTVSSDLAIGQDIGLDTENLPSQMNWCLTETNANPSKSSPDATVQQLSNASPIVNFSSPNQSNNLSKPPSLGVGQLDDGLESVDGTGKKVM